MTSGGYHTYTHSDTFTGTHAKHIAAKVAADLKRMQRFYGKPDDGEITDYEKEVGALLLGNYLESVTYGFRRRDGNQWIVALKYIARQGGVLIEDDSPGQIPIGAPIEGGAFHSFLCYNREWHRLLSHQQTQVYRNAGIRFERKEGKEPRGDFSYNKAYSAGGRGVLRGVVG